MLGRRNVAVFAPEVVTILKVARVWSLPVRRRLDPFTAADATAPYTSRQSVVQSIGEDHFMFRQVVVCRWSKDVSDERKQGFRDAMERLREIPELLAMKFGDDAGHFEGNFDFAAVMDFADFNSARDYVANPIHQAYVRDHASQVIDERVIVQHEWTE